MSLVDNVDNVAFATAFEVDKIYPQKFSGLFNVSGSTRSTETITNPYGEDVFPVMQYSTDDSTWLDAGAVSYDSSGGSDYQATCYTTSGSIVIVAENYTGSIVTFYYRMVLISDD